jgi:hypothetical protein
MLEVFTNSTAPSLIAPNFESDVQEYDYGQIVKGIVHAWIIPFIIAFIAPQYSLVYIACAGFLYSTVFRDKSDGFFGAVVFSMLIIAIMVIPN